MADKQYDLSPRELELLRKKAQMRLALREQYQKQITNPHRHATNEGGTVFDAGIQRFMSVKATGYEYFKPTPKNGAMAFGLTIFPIALFAYCLKANRDAAEHKYRTGQVSYADRRFKFI